MLTRDDQSSMAGGSRKQRNEQRLRRLEQPSNSAAATTIYLESCAEDSDAHDTEGRRVQETATSVKSRHSKINTKPFVSLS
jgi:hypothetical protein